VIAVAANEGAAAAAAVDAAVAVDAAAAAAAAAVDAAVAVAAQLAVDVVDAAAVAAAAAASAVDLQQCMVERWGWLQCQQQLLLPTGTLTDVSGWVAAARQQPCRYMGSLLWSPQWCSGLRWQGVQGLCWRQGLCRRQLSCWRWWWRRRQRARC